MKEYIPLCLVVGAAMATGEIIRRINLMGLQKPLFVERRSCLDVDPWVPEYGSISWRAYKQHYVLLIRMPTCAWCVSAKQLYVGLLALMLVWWARPSQPEKADLCYVTAIICSEDVKACATWSPVMRTSELNDQSVPPPMHFRTGRRAVSDWRSSSYL